MTAGQCFLLIVSSSPQVSYSLGGWYSQAGYVRSPWPWARFLVLAADLIDAFVKISGKSQVLLTLVSRARAPKHPKRCFSRNAAILLHGLKESLRKKLLNALVKSCFRCTCFEERAKNMLPKVGPGGILRLASLSPFCASGGFQDLRPLCAALMTST